MRKLGIYFILFWITIIPNFLLAQDEPNDVVVFDNGFQDLFYDALKEKSIENYDKALDILQKCKDKEPENAVVYFELGKNYLALKKYKESYDNFEKAAQIDPENRWALHGMYDACYATQDFYKAIPIVEKLTKFKDDYKEDLTSLYMNTQQYDKALELINELNDKYGETEKRELFKWDILKNPKFQSTERNHLLDLIKKYPKEESNYVALISLYSQNNEEEKALEISKKLEKEIPSSDWAQVSLFKLYLDKNEGDNAVKAMNTVLLSNKIDNKIKHRIINEFLIFSKNNPQYENDLDKAISYFNDDKEVDVAKEIGEFYYSKLNWIKAIKYFEKHLSNSVDDIETQILLMQSYTELKNFEALANKSDTLTQLFPTQPEFYYYAGLANNQLNNFKKAISFLDTGIDFVLDNITLEINFTIQLGEAYNGLGDIKKKEKYFKRAQELIKS